MAGQYSLQAIATDPGTRDTQTYAWSLTGGTAVGSTSDSSFTVTPTTGPISVVLTVTDDDTGSVSARTPDPGPANRE